MTYEEPKNLMEMPLEKIVMRLKSLKKGEQFMYYDGWLPKSGRPDEFGTIDTLLKMGLITVASKRITHNLVYANGTSNRFQYFAQALKDGEYVKKERK